jgi:hypothetical protein
LRRRLWQAPISVLLFSLAITPNIATGVVSPKRASATVTMRLAWPATREAKIEAARTSETTGAEAKPTVTLKAKYESKETTLLGFFIPQTIAGRTDLWTYPMIQFLAVIDRGATDELTRDTWWLLLRRDQVRHFRRA